LYANFKKIDSEDDFLHMYYSDFSVFLKFMFDMVVQQQLK